MGFATRFFAVAEGAAEADSDGVSSRSVDGAALALALAVAVGSALARGFAVGAIAVLDDPADGPGASSLVGLGTGGVVTFGFGGVTFGAGSGGGVWRASAYPPRAAPASATMSDAATRT